VGDFLHRKGVPVARPLCCLLVSEGSLLLTEGLTRGIDYSSRWQQLPSEQEQKAMMTCAAQTLAQLHLLKYFHGDCQWNNLLWREGQCYVVNLDLAGKSRFGASRRAVDLARFTADAEEREIDPELYGLFLDTYVRAIEIPREQLLEKMKSPLAKFRSSHEQQHGVMAEPLL